MLNDRINGFRRWIQKQNQLAGSGAIRLRYVTSSPYAHMFVANPRASEAFRRPSIAFKTLFPQYFPDVFRTARRRRCQPARRLRTQQSPIAAECLYLILDEGPALRYRAAQRRRPQGDRDGRHRQRRHSGNRRRLGASAPLLSLADATRPAWRTANRDGDKSSQPRPRCRRRPFSMGGAAPRSQSGDLAANTTYAVGTIILPKRRRKRARSRLFISASRLTGRPNRVGLSPRGAMPQTWATRLGTEHGDSGPTSSGRRCSIHSRSIRTIRWGRLHSGPGRSSRRNSQHVEHAADRLHGDRPR